MKVYIVANLSCEECGCGPDIYRVFATRQKAEEFLNWIQTSLDLYPDTEAEIVERDVEDGTGMNDWFSPIQSSSNTAGIGLDNIQYNFGGQ